MKRVLIEQKDLNKQERTVWIGRGGDSSTVAIPWETLPKGMRGRGGSVVQCSARDLKVASLILAHSSFLVRGLVLSLTLADLYGL